MGKVKMKKSRPSKSSCPTGLADVKDMENEESMDGNKVKSAPAMLQKIFDKMQSESVDEKECACYMLTNLAEEQENASIILEHNVIKVTCGLLVDPSVVIRHAAAGALRALTVSNAETTCEVLVKRDVMTPLVTLFKEKYAPGWKPTQENDPESEVFIDIVNLLWNLCENSNRAVEIFNQCDLQNILIPCLDWNIYSYKIAVTVGQCLHAVSEDNLQLINKLNDQVHLPGLNHLIDLKDTGAGALFLRILALGIVVNIYSQKLLDCTPNFMTKIMSVLSDTLSVNFQPLIQAVVEKVCVKKDKNFNLSSILWVLSSQQVAIEILTNLCCDEEDDAEWENVSSSDASDDIKDNDVTMEDNEKKNQCPITIPIEIHEAIVNLGLCKKIVNLIDPITQEMYTNLQSNNAGKQICTSFQVLKSRALMCLTNIVTCLDINELGGIGAVYDIWMNFATIAFRETKNGNDGEAYLEAVTGAMRSITQSLAEAKCTKFEQMNTSDVQQFIDIVTNCKDAGVIVNMIHIIGTMGWVMGNVCQHNPNSSAIITIVSNFLLELCGKDRELWIEAEALDALFDVFAEDHLDGIAREIGLVERLKNILPKLKHRINSQKKHLEGHSAIILTSRTNLIRFLKYKTKSVQNGNHAL